MEIAQELCHRLLKEQYQYVIAIHTDHDHTHAHIIVNNTNFITGRTFETEHNQGKKKDRAWAKVRRISDELCKENNLSVIEHPEEVKGKSHWEWDMDSQSLFFNLTVFTNRSTVFVRFPCFFNGFYRL